VTKRMLSRRPHEQTGEDRPVRSRQGKKTGMCRKRRNRGNSKRIDAFGNCQRREARSRKSPRTSRLGRGGENRQQSVPTATEVFNEVGEKRKSETQSRAGRRGNTPLDRHTANRQNAFPSHTKGEIWARRADKEKGRRPSRSTESFRELCI